MGAHQGCAGTSKAAVPKLGEIFHLQWRLKRAGASRALLETRRSAPATRVVNSSLSAIVPRSTWYPYTCLWENAAVLRHNAERRDNEQYSIHIYHVTITKSRDCADLAMTSRCACESANPVRRRVVKRPSPPVTMSFLQSEREAAAVSGAAAPTPSEGFNIPKST